MLNQSATRSKYCCGKLLKYSFETSQTSDHSTNGKSSQCPHGHYHSSATTCRLVDWISKVVESKRQNVENQSPKSDYKILCHYKYPQTL